MTRIGVGYADPKSGFGIEMAYASLGEFSSDYSSNISGIGNVQANAVISGSAILIPITYSTNHFFDFKYPDGLTSIFKFGLASTQGKYQSTIIGGAGIYNGTTSKGSAGGTEFFSGFGLIQKMSDNISFRLQFESLPFLAASDNAGGARGINNLRLWSVGLSTGF